MGFNISKNMSKVTIWTIAAGIAVAGIVFYIGYYVGGEKSASHASLTDTDMVTQEQFASFWKAWDILNKKDLNATSTSAQDKVYGAIQGLAASYNDPYTVFFPPVQSKMFNDDIAGDFDGIGMEIGIKDKQLVVVAPIKDSPAMRAGVKTGELILKINATSTEGMSTDQAVQFIRGPKGTSVSITFLPVGSSAPVVRKIVRDVINIPTLDTQTKPGGVFVIRLYSFTAQSPDLFRAALRKFILSGDNKLVLDLRGNPGGYLDAAWDMASWFLPVGKIIVTEDFAQHAAPNVYRSKGYDVFNSNLKMLILVDGGSASAAEILAGALQEQGIAKLVGSKTFGKGVVQELIPITPDTSLKVTVARWMTPLGHNLSHDGLEADYPVTATSSDPTVDPVMNRALQLLGQ